MRPALLVGVIALLLAGCAGTSEPFVPAAKAPPQEAALDWVERYPPRRPALIFGVRSFAVTRTGWKADITVGNRSSVSWELGAAGFSLERAFGVMLFATGDLEELDRRNRDGTLPAIRRATAYTPSLPPALEPGTTWSGTISAPGPLAAGLWVRLSFGTFTSMGEPPAGTEPQVLWFTDHAVQLRG